MSDVPGTTRVTILDEPFAIRSEADPEYTRQVAGHVDSSLREIREKAPSMEPFQAAVLGAMEITDELFRARARHAELESEMAERIERGIKKVTLEEYFTSGHRTCQGCESALVMKLMVKASGPRTIVLGSTGCMYVANTTYYTTPWVVPWMHTQLGSSGSAALGTAAGLLHAPKTSAVCPGVSAPPTTPGREP